MPVGQPVAVLALLIAMALWGSSFVALKIAFADYHPMWVIFLRMLVAGICFLFFARRVMQFNYHRGDWKRLLGLSLAEPCLYFVFEAAALNYTSAAQAGMIVGLLPLMVALLARWWLGERVSRWMITGSCVAIGGVAGLSLLSAATEAAPNPLLGNALELLAMFCAAVYSTQLKLLSPRYSPFALTALQGLSGSIFFLPLALMAPAPTVVSWPAIGAIIYLGAGVTLGAYLCYNIAISRLPVTVASTFSNLIPVFSLVIAFAVLGERFTSGQLACAAVVIIGVVVSQKRPAATHHHEPPLAQ